MNRSKPQSHRDLEILCIETKHFLRRAYRRQLLTREQVNSLKPIVDELAPSLNAYLRSIGDVQEKKTSNGNKSSQK